MEPLSVDLFDQGELEIFPNPSNGIYEIKLGNSVNQNLTVEIYSLAGNLVRRQELSNVRSFSLDIHEESNGTYLMKINDGERVGVFKLLKN